jgi:hypothetical protein
MREPGRPARGRHSTTQTSRHLVQQMCGRHSTHTDIPPPRSANVRQAQHPHRHPATSFSKRAAGTTPTQTSRHRVQHTCGRHNTHTDIPPPRSAHVRQAEHHTDIPPPRSANVRQAQHPHRHPATAFSTRAAGRAPHRHPATSFSKRAAGTTPTQTSRHRVQQTCGISRFGKIDQDGPQPTRIPELGNGPRSLG